MSHLLLSWHGHDHLSYHFPMTLVRARLQTLIMDRYRNAFLNIFACMFNKVFNLMIMVSLRMAVSRGLSCLVFFLVLKDRVYFLPMPHYTKAVFAVITCPSVTSRAVPNTVISLFGRIPNIYLQYSAEYGSSSNSLDTIVDENTLFNMQ